MEQWSDEDLMAAVMDGKMQALAILITRYHGLLLGYLYRLTAGNRALADDLVQETFVRLLRQSSYQTGRPFKVWLVTIATNLYRDHLKAAATRTNIPYDDVLHAVADAAPGPESLALAHEQGREIATALGTLSVEYRSVLILRYYYDLSLQEIAATLGIPLGTVKSRLSTGTRRLRALLQAECRTGDEQGG